MTDPTITRLEPSIFHETRETTAPDPGSGLYGERADTATSWTVEGVALDAKGRLMADFPVGAGDTVHVVYAIYSTGDSYGNDERARIEFFTVHADQALAERNAAILRQVPRKGPPPSIATDGGIEIPAHVPWNGYFESLDEVAVGTFVVEAG